MSEKMMKWKRILMNTALACFIGEIPITASAQEPVQLKLASFKIGSG